jgi:hypothetical protein
MDVMTWFTNQFLFAFLRRLYQRNDLLVRWPFHLLWNANGFICSDLVTDTVMAVNDVFTKKTYCLWGYKNIK